MSCFQSRQSKEMDSVNWATSAAGPLAKRPLRDTGDDFVLTPRLLAQTHREAKVFVAEAVSFCLFERPVIPPIVMAMTMRGEKSSAILPKPWPYLLPVCLRNS